MNSPGKPTGRPPRGRARPPALEVLEDRTLLSAGLPAAEIDLSGLALDPGAYDPSHILVRFKHDALRGGAPAARLAGTTVAGALPLVPGLYEVRLAPGVSVEAALAAYRADAGVLAAEPDYALTTNAIPNDARFKEQWSLNNTGQGGGKAGADVRAAQAWSTTQGTGRVVVAVMDSGIDYTHPDLYLNVWVNQGEIPKSRRAKLLDVNGDGRINFRDLKDSRNVGPGKITDLNGNGRIDAGDLLKPMVKDAKGADTGKGGWADGADGDKEGHVDDLVGWNSSANNNNPLDNFGHGTHVAGTIGATGNNGAGVAGVAWNVQLMPVKFLSGGGHGSISQFISGLNYAVAHGAKISNNSWTGADNSSLLLNALAAARAKGHVFVAAAGNGGANIDAKPSYPASFKLDNVVTVAATDRHDKLAKFSNYGPGSVDLAAPGVQVLSTTRGGGYGLNGGTSMAAPHVTGALALVWGLHPNWSYAQVINRVLKTVDKLPTLQGKTGSGGRLNVAAAVGGAKPATAKPASVQPAGAPRVVSAAANGPRPGALGGWRVTFAQPVHLPSITAADVKVVGPGGRAVAVTGLRAVAGSGNRAFDVTFAPQTNPGTYTLRVGPEVRDGAGRRMTAAHQATFTLSAPVTVTSTAKAAINPKGRAASALAVKQDLPVADVNVRVNVTFPRDADLVLRLQAPDGTNVVLSNRGGGTAAGFPGTVFDDQAPGLVANAKAPLSGTYRPATPLKVLHGKNARGVWKLWVEDKGGRYKGTLHGWSLTFVRAATGGGPRAASADEAFAASGWMNDAALRLGRGASAEG